MAGPTAAAERAMRLSELTPHLVCPLCGGYYIDATAIVECLHTFCRSCILRHLRRTRRCPAARCEVLVQKAQGGSAAGLRPDATLQSIVYKTVPGLHRDEMRRRQLFHADKPDSADDSLFCAKGPEEDGGAHFYDDNDTIELQIQYASQRPEDVVPVRYLRCSAGMPLPVLRKFLLRKYRLSENLQVELFHRGRRLPGDVKLLDVAYMFNWDRELPLGLLFRMCKSSTAVKRPADVPLEKSDRPPKVGKLDDNVALPASIVQEAGKGQSSSHQTQMRPAKAAAEAVCKGLGGTSVKKVDIKRSVSNCSSFAGKRVKQMGRGAGEGSSSGSVAVEQKSKSESNMASTPLRNRVRQARVSSTVTIEHADKKRRVESIDVGRKNTKDAAMTPMPNKIPKTALSYPEQQQKSSPKLQPSPSSSLRLGDSTFSADDLSPNGKVDKVKTYTEPDDFSPQRSGAKDKKTHPANSHSQYKEKHRNHSDTGTDSGRVGQEHELRANQADVASQDSNANTLKLVSAHREGTLRKEPPNHQGLGTKGPSAKTTDAPKPLHEQQTFKKTNDAHANKSSSHQLGSTSECFLRTAFKSQTIPGTHPVQTESNSSMLTTPLQPVKTKQNTGKSPKTTSHGTNTLLSSSPRISKSQMSSPGSPAQKPALTASYSSPGETLKAELSERCPRSLSKTTCASDNQNTASKTIFLFSGSKKPQNSTKIMSIVESLTQRSLLSSLAKKGSAVSGRNLPVKPADSTNAALRSSMPSTLPKAPSVSTNGTFVAPGPVPARSVAATPVCPVSSPLHIETASLGLRYGSALPPLSSLSRTASSNASSTSCSSRPVFPVPPLPQRPKSQSVRSIPNPSLVRQRSAEERARDCGKGSPTAGSTAPAMSPPAIRDIHSLTRQLQEAGTSVTITNTTC